jgi:hypothetical protein
MQRTIVPKGKYRSQSIAPGVTLESFYPGGKNGPNREVHADVPGGQTWSDMLLLGSSEDAFQLLLPDIRMPPNQYWPLHWHDAWTAVLLLEGQCCIGDWWMQPGDVFVTEPSLEYGPLVSGPQGCRLFEIFAKAHLALGGYAPEYRGHPTLQGTNAAFQERSDLNRRNVGHQVLHCDGVPGIVKTRLSPGASWNLGLGDDPDRGVMKDTRLDAGKTLPAHSYDDWHGILVFEGSLRIAGLTLSKDDYLVIAPNRRVEEIHAGPNGVQLLELARTARGMDARPLV